MTWASTWLSMGHYLNGRRRYMLPSSCWPLSICIAWMWSSETSSLKMLWLILKAMCCLQISAFRSKAFTLTRWLVLSAAHQLIWLLKWWSKKVMAKGLIGTISALSYLRCYVEGPLSMLRHGKKFSIWFYINLFSSQISQNWAINAKIF